MNRVIIFLVILNFIFKNLNAQDRITGISLEHDDFPKATFSFSYLGNLNFGRDAFQVDLWENGKKIQVDEVFRMNRFEKVRYYFVFNDFRNPGHRDKVLTSMSTLWNPVGTEKEVFVCAKNGNVTLNIPVDDLSLKSLDTLVTLFETEEIARIYSGKIMEASDNITKILFVVFYNPRESDYNELQRIVSSQLKDKNRMLIAVPFNNKRIDNLYTSNEPPGIFIDEKQFYLVRSNSERFFTNWFYRKLNINFTIPDYKNLSEDRTYRISLKGIDHEDVAEFHYTIPSELLLQRFEEMTLQKADSFLRQFLYKDALEFLQKEYHYPDVRIQPIKEKAAQILLEYGEIVLKKQEANLLEKYPLVEKIWSDYTFDSGYYQKKEDLFRQYFFQLDQSGGDFREKANVSDSLLMFDPRNEKYILNSYRSHAELQIFQGNFWDGAAYYSRYLKNKKDAQIEAKRKEVVLRAIQTSHDNGQWEEVYINGGKYENIYITPSKKNRFIFAEAAFKTGNYDKALEHYEYLIHNWKSNDRWGKLSWQYLLKQLQTTLSHNLNFDKAIALNRNIYLNKSEGGESSNNTAIRRKLLKTSLLNLRLKYLKPVLEIFSEVNTTYPNVSLKPSKNNFPREITAVAVLSNRGRLNYLYRKENISNSIVRSISNSIGGMKTIFDDAIKYGWFYSKTNRGTLIIQVNNEVMDNTEKNMFKSIYTTPKVSQAWNNLYTYEEDKGLNACSQLLTFFIGQNIKEGNFSSKRIWRTLSRSGFIKYLDVYTGEEQHFHHGLPEGSLKYPPGTYERSSRAVAFYKIEVSNEDQEIIDISNPVYDEAGWKGVLRIGFTKKW